MTWTCTKCGTLHETPEQRKACARAERKTNAMAAFIILGLVALFFVLYAGFAQIMYGDWKCAFVHCVSVKVTK